VWYCPPMAALASASSSLWRGIGRLNHIALAVPDLGAAVAMWRDVMGGDVSAPQPLPEHGVTAVFITLPNTKLELLHPLGESSLIAPFLKRNPAGGMHHVCLEVDCLSVAIGTLEERGMRVLPPGPNTGAHGNQVAFLHPNSCGGVLLELEEAEPAAA